MDTETRLILDDQTLRDLEVFSDSNGDTGLFKLVDSTKTSLGSKQLRARLKRPFVDPDEIVSIQKTLNFLRRNVAIFPFEEELLISVERYLKSRIVAGPQKGAGSKFTAVFRTLRYPDMYTELSKGVEATLEFLSRFQEFCEHVLTKKPGEKFSSLLRLSLASISEIKAQAGPQGRPRTVWAVLECDSLLRLHRSEQMHRLLETAAEIDALQAMANFGDSPEYQVPEVSAASGVLSASGLFHPLVKKAVGNPLELDDVENVMFLTGPNMAGKSTYLKAIGIAQILAQSGMRVPARHFVFSPVEEIFAGINTSDNISEGVSYYMAEVQRVKMAGVVLAAGRQALMLFDEVFKGTNVVDAMEATRLVIKYCKNMRGSKFIFSSHLSGLSSELEIMGVQQRSFKGSLNDGVPSYCYEIGKGSSDQRMGLHLLEQEGVFQLLKKAREKFGREAAT